MNLARSLEAACCAVAVALCAAPVVASCGEATLVLFNGFGKLRVRALTAAFHKIEALRDCGNSFVKFAVTDKTKMFRVTPRLPLPSKLRVGPKPTLKTGPKPTSTARPFLTSFSDGWSGCPAVLGQVVVNLHATPALKLRQCRWWSSVSGGHQAQGDAGLREQRSKVQGGTAEEASFFGKGLLKRLGMLPEQLVTQDKNFNRYRLVPAAMANHLCLGAIYAWSIFNEPLTRLQGVLAPASADWALGDISLVFSLVMGGFVWGAVLGKYLDLFGPRATCVIGSLCFGAGFGLAAAAVNVGSLPLLCFGGAVWGLANGWAYVPPVATLLKWFPDRKGFASGACLVGFGIFLVCSF